MLDNKREYGNFIEVEKCALNERENYHFHTKIILIEMSNYLLRKADKTDNTNGNTGHARDDA